MASRQYTERDRKLRVHWLAVALHMPAEHLICLDESASNRRTGTRRFGWSRCGAIARSNSSADRGERWSICPALTINGYLPGALVTDGPILQEHFTDWVASTVLPHATRGRSIIVMDNHSIHQDPRLVELCEEAGVIIEWLPPYSPDYNPIKLSFNELKAWVRRHSDMAWAYESFGHFLVDGLQQVASPQACRGYFRKAGYTIG